MLIKLKLLFTLLISTSQPVSESKIIIGELDSVVKKNATLIELMEKYQYNYISDTTSVKMVE